MSEHIESARTYLYNVGPYGQVGSVGFPSEPLDSW